MERCSIRRTSRSQQGGGARMQGNVLRAELGGVPCLVYLPPQYASGQERYPVVYAADGRMLETGLAEIIELLEPGFAAGSCRPFILVSPLDERRDDDYTPWPAPPLSKNGRPFGGRADACLARLTELIKPAVDRAYRTLSGPADTALAGYSLGGLFAVYAVYRTGVFGLFAGISGSLWYDGFAAYALEHAPASAAARVYLSLGKAESRRATPRMKCVEQAAEQVFASLRRELKSTAQTVLRRVPGDHFYEIPERYRLALTWLFGGEIEERK